MARPVAFMLASALAAACAGGWAGPASAAKSADAITGAQFDLECSGTAEVTSLDGSHFSFATAHRLRVDVKAGGYFVESGNLLGRTGEGRPLVASAGHALILARAAATSQDDYDAIVDRRTGAYAIDNRWRGPGFPVTADRGVCRQAPFTPFSPAAK